MIRTPMPFGSRRRARPFLLPAVLFAAILLGGCAHQVTRLPHDCGGPGGWCPQSRTVAAETWEYAQLAQNAYWQEAQESDDYLDRPYVLRPELKERYATVDDHYGYAYSLFDRFDDTGRLSEVVLVYRGTEGPKDWWHGTLLGRQGARGVETYRLVRKALDDAGYGAVPIALAGHSLGGRITDHVLKTLEDEDGPAPPTLSSYLFNPNASGTALAQPGDWNDPVHVAVSESGEIAAWVRALARDAAWDGYVIDCQTTVDPVARHYMRRLADCLTWVAALDDKAASVSAQRNEIDPPPTNGGQVPGANRQPRSETGADQPVVE